MAKELPYFQFEPAEYLTKDISFCSLSAQGLFINICSFYWQRQCSLTKDQFLRRFNYLSEFEELVKEGVIDVENEQIKIKFLDNQYLKATGLSAINSANGSKGGRPKKPTKTENKPNQNRNETETKGIREDNIKEDEIKEDEIPATPPKKIITIETKIKKFEKDCFEYLEKYGDELINNFINYWTEKSDKPGAKMRFEKQEFFEIGKRLATWAKNDNNFKNKNNATFNRNHTNNSNGLGSKPSKQDGVNELAQQLREGLQQLSLNTIAG